MKYKYLIGLNVCLLLAGLTSCQSTKFVPQDKYLLDKISIESDVPNYPVSQIRPYLKQQPNLKMFGLFKSTLWIYNLSGKKDTGFNRFIRRLGDAPIIYDPYLQDKTENELRKLFFNMGYINVEVSSEAFSHDRKMNLVYRIQGNQPYRIRHYTTDISDTTIRQEVFGGAQNDPMRTISGETSVLRTPALHDSLLFDRNALDYERDRLTTLLHNRGYYAFSKDRIMFDADTALNANAVDLTMRLRPPTDSLTKLFNRQFYYDRVKIYLDYNPIETVYTANDSVNYKGYTIVYQHKKPSLRPAVLADNCFIEPSELFSRQNEDRTYSAFSNMRALNNIQIQYEPKLRNDSTLLDASLLLIPAKKQSVSVSLEGTNTAGDLGAAAAINYTHRNLFRGSETFNLRVRGAYEAMSNFSNPYLEYGSEASFHVPKFVLPFLRTSAFRRLRPTTEFALSYNYQSRPEYDRTLLSGGWRYQWQGKNQSAVRHRFDLINVDYVYLPRKDSTFMNKLPVNAQYFGYTDQFIVGMSYSYYYSTAEFLNKRSNAHSWRWSIESAGNALYGISRLADREKNTRGVYQLLNTPFAQFLKGDFDFTYNVILDPRNSIVWHIGGGVGVPYGNSEILPFEKRYYSGGANSVRAWSVRELGPGSYQPNASTTFYHQTGDIKLDANLEYRSHFIWKLEFAAFIDAGNIWTIKGYEGQENGRFRFDSFYKEIALGYGLGIRFDFDYFLIRFDFAEKAYNPAKRGKDRWAILHPNFGENFAWHIAVGYPF
ncbi:MAG: outer membrane protein assembly factor [Candidatus Symbiothrix sp.]|jgi:outer membrane protein assembly factor BamA|nr:outer membrane protein assembly factor [Candidatus Symbiothrix sp.]